MLEKDLSLVLDIEILLETKKISLEWYFEEYNSILESIYERIVIYDRQSNISKFTGSEQDREILRKILRRNFVYIDKIEPYFFLYYFDFLKFDEKITIECLTLLSEKSLLSPELKHTEVFMKNLGQILRNSNFTSIPHDLLRDIRNMISPQVIFQYDEEFTWLWCLHLIGHLNEVPQFLLHCLNVIPVNEWEENLQNIIHIVFPSQEFEFFPENWYDKKVISKIYHLIKNEKESSQNYDVFDLTMKGGINFFYKLVDLLPLRVFCEKIHFIDFLKITRDADFTIFLIKRIKTYLSSSLLTMLIQVGSIEYKILKELLEYSIILPRDDVKRYVSEEIITDNYVIINLDRHPNTNMEWYEINGCWESNSSHITPRIELLRNYKDIFAESEELQLPTMLRKRIEYAKILIEEKKRIRQYYNHWYHILSFDCITAIRDLSKELNIPLLPKYHTPLDTLDAELINEMRSKGRLHDAPRFVQQFSSITELKISWLNIKDIPSAITQFKHLKKIDLSHNMIETIPDKILTYLKTIEKVDISWNKIQDTEKLEDFENIHFYANPKDDKEENEVFNYRLESI